MTLRTYAWAFSVALVIPLAAACGSDSGGGGGGGGAGATDGGAGSGGATGGAAGSGGATGGAAGSGGATGGAGGSGGSTGGAGGTAGGGGALGCSQFSSVTKDAACQSYATAYCGLLDNCAPSLLSLLRFADATDCAAQLAAICKNGLDAPGMGVKAAGWAAMGDLLSKLTCDQVYDGALTAIESPKDPSCVVPGALTTGTACYEDGQCQSDNCEIPDNMVCGKCTAPTGAGSACTFASDCPDDYYCGANDTCVPRKKLGEDCSGGSLCVDGAFCSTGANPTCIATGGVGASCKWDDECTGELVCSAAGSCKKADLGAAGATCDPDETRSCNSYLNLECDTATTKCVAKSIHGPGESCGIKQVGNTVVFDIYCSGGASCVMPGSSNTGTCIKIAAVGGQCDTDTGPDCGIGVECVNGTCQLGNPTNCPAN